ncbi:MAG TPA: 6-carboxytetrahydropterin synthase QueD [Ruminococcus sp.]|nr:6-carboxytetrahydropterin synthase QueD [Ruminococcus sp.]
MYILKTSAAFDSAHFLAGYNGKCANLHGHHWVIEAEAAADSLQESGEKRGMVIDFGDLKKAVRQLADAYDHALIYEQGSLKAATLTALHDEGFRLIEVPCRPTAENFAKAFFEALTAQGIPLRRMTVYETPENCASYEV